MASIRKKGRGYEARVKIHGTTRSKSFATMQQGRVWARNAELDFVATPEPVSASVPASTFTTSITLADALKRFKAEVLPKLRGTPQERYRVAALATTAMASQCLSAITAAAVKAYRDSLAGAGNSRSTVRLKFALLSRVFSVAAKGWGYAVANAVANPVASVTKPPAGKARSRRLTSAEEQRLLESASQCQNPHIAPASIVQNFQSAVERLKYCAGLQADRMSLWIGSNLKFLRGCIKRTTLKGPTMSFWQILGRFAFSHQGETIQRVSDTTSASSDGNTYTSMGSTTVGSDGSVFIQTGSFSSDGSTRMGSTATGLGGVFKPRLSDCLALWQLLDQRINHL